MDDSTGGRDGDDDPRRENGPDRPTGASPDTDDDGDPGADPFDRANEPSRRGPDGASDGDRTAGDSLDGGSGGDRNRPDENGDDGDGEDGQWRFGLEDVGEDGIVRPSLDPGTPKLENVVFVLLGVAAMVLLIVRLWLLI